MQLCEYKNCNGIRAKSCRICQHHRDIWRDHEFYPWGQPSPNHDSFAKFVSGYWDNIVRNYGKEQITESSTHLYNGNSHAEIGTDGKIIFYTDNGDSPIFDVDDFSDWLLSERLKEV